MSQPQTETVEDNPRPSKTSTKTWALIVLGVLAIGAVLIVLAFIVFGNARLSEFVLSNGSSLIIIISTTLFISTLAALAALYHGLELTDPKESLGLPAGSVRALIALFLLLAFVVMSLFVFQVMSRGVGGSVLEGISLEEYVALRELEPGTEIHSRTAGTPPTYTVSIYRELPETATQLALQIFTVLGTLVGTISGFYFGTRSLETAGNIFNPGGGGGTLSVSSMKPDKAKPGDQLKAVILGQGFANVTSVSLWQNGSGATISAEVPNQQNDTSLTCTFNLAGAAPGVYDLLVRTNATAVVLNNALMVSPPPAPPSPPTPTVTPSP